MIEKIPTTNLAAFYFYRRGVEEYSKCGFPAIDQYYATWLDTNNLRNLERAERYFYNATREDPTFAKAYAEWAKVYFYRHYLKAISTRAVLDSVLILCNIALKYDRQLADAYTFRGYYFMQISEANSALKEFNNALKYNPNDWKAYYGKGLLNELYDSPDFVNALINLKKAYQLNQGTEMAGIIGTISSVFKAMGFFNESEEYSQKVLELDHDSLLFYRNLAEDALHRGEPEVTIELNNKVIKMDSATTRSTLWLGESNMFLRRPAQSLKYYKRFWNKASEGNLLSNYFDMHRLAWAYDKSSGKDSSSLMLEKHLKNLNHLLEKGNYSPVSHVYYDLAAAYAYKGDENKAFYYLRLWSKQNDVITNWWNYFINNDPLYDSIRAEPEFQEIARNVKAKYLNEYDRVKKWLEDQGKP